MKILARKLIAGLLAVSSVFALSACGKTDTPVKSDAKQETSGEQKKEAGEQTDAGATKISFLTSQGKFKQEYRQMAEAIKKDHNIDIDFQVVPDNEYASLLKVKLSTSEVPDVFEYNYPTQNMDIGASQYCEDLSSEPWVSRLVNPEITKDPQDGKMYALPKESSSTFMTVVYNKKVLSDLGIENPEPKTYQEFIAILNTVKEKGNGITPLLMTNKDTWTTQIFMTAGYPVALDGKGTETFNKLLKNEIKWADVPEFKNVLTDFNALIEGGYVNKDHLSSTYDMAYDIMGTGKAAMYLTIDAFTSDMRVKYPDVELGSFIIPFNNVQKMAIGQYVQGLFVPKAGKQVDKVKAFLTIWSDPKYQSIYYNAIPGFPAFKDVDGGNVVPCIQELVDKYITTGKYVYQINDQMSICSTIWPDMWDYYVEVAAGAKKPEGFFDKWQKVYDDYMQQQQQPGF